MIKLAGKAPIETFDELVQISRTSRHGAVEHVLCEAADQLPRDPNSPGPSAPIEAARVPRGFLHAPTVARSR